MEGIGVRIASVTMLGHFPDGISLHARNLKSALSQEDHHYIVTSSRFISKYKLENDNRVTYIDFGECDNTRTFIPFWKEFPRLIRQYEIEPEWFLFMEQDIWFYQTIKDDPLPAPKEIRSHLPVLDKYHSVMINDSFCHSRVWEGSILLDGPLVQRAVSFGIDFSGHANWFIAKYKEYWNNLAGGTISLGQYDHADTMDEFTLYCARGKDEDHV